MIEPDLISVASLLSLLTLTLMEIVLGIDNIVFISIVSSKVEPRRQQFARLLGLSLALVIRILLLFSIVWIIGLQKPLFSLFGQPFSWRDIILLAGGVFLLVKGTLEIHEKLEGEPHMDTGTRRHLGIRSAIVQIILLDMVFSVDSILTAIGIGEHLEIMVVAVVISMVVMLFSAKAISDFVHKHPTIKMLALSFLLLIGVLLAAEGLHFHIPKGYVYTAMAFSLAVEMLNMRIRGDKRKPVQLRSSLVRRVRPHRPEGNLGPYTTGDKSS